MCGDGDEVWKGAVGVGWGVAGGWRGGKEVAVRADGYGDGMDGCE